MNMSIKETEKYIRDCIRDHGLVFKKSKNNNLYLITDRTTKQIVISNTTLGNTLDNVCSGYFSTYDRNTQNFCRDELKNIGLIAD